MSHTIPFRLVFPTHLVDVLDDAWLGEVLPDDDIPLPEGVAPPSEDPDDLPEGGATEPPPEPRWSELGLEDLQ